MLSHGDSTLDEVIEIFWDFLVDTIGLKDSGDSGASIVVDETNSVVISQDCADL